LLPRCRSAVLFLLLACGAAPARSVAPGAESPQAASDRSLPSTSPDPFVPRVDPADVLARWVSTTRSSRVATPLPQGAPRLAFRAALDRQEPLYVLAASNRIAVVSTRELRLFDARGRRAGFAVIDDDALVMMDPDVGSVHTVSKEGAMASFKLDDATVQGDRQKALYEPAVAAYRGTVFVAREGKSIRVWDVHDPKGRVVLEGNFEPLEVAIDLDGIAYLVVRQGHEISLWSVPLAGGSIGRVKLPSRPGDKIVAPPILGKDVRVVRFEDRIVALARDGKVLYTRPGAISGGATMTADDKLLVAHEGSITAIDSQGRATDIVTDRSSRFLTPPIVVGGPMLLVASAKALSGYTF
jgi:hypothetical protein